MNRIAEISILAAVLGLLLPAAAAGQSTPLKEKADKPSGSTKLRIEVTGGPDGRTIEGASVYVKYERPRTLAKDKKIEMNVKTNREGIARVPDVPRGKVLIQVIAEGWKPFGRWYNLEEEAETIKIRLEKPPRWY